MSPALRFAGLYAGVYLSLGAALPFLPVFLESRGLEPERVAIVLALGQIARFIGGPLGAALADRMRDRRLALVLFGLVACLAALTHLAGHSVATLGASAVLHGLAAGPLSPIADALAVHAARASGFDFGRVRASGSLAFVVGTLLGGLWLQTLGPDGIVWLMAGGVALALPTALLLPRVQAPPARHGRGSVLVVLRHPGFGLLLLGSGLVQGSHAGYYAFATIYWRAEGLSDTAVSLLWAWGVVAEIALLVFARAPVARLGPLRLACLAGIAAVLRWTASAFVTAPLGLALLQTLHAATFGALMLGTVLWISTAIAPERGATAQALHAGLGQGTGTFALTLAAGPLFAWAGPGMFLAMALAAGVGTLVLLAVPGMARREAG